MPLTNSLPVLYSFLSERSPSFDVAPSILKAPEGGNAEILPIAVEDSNFIAETLEVIVIIMKSTKKNFFNFIEYHQI